MVGHPHDRLEWEVPPEEHGDMDMTIDSDASLTGWGATSQNHEEIVGPWSKTESRMHINCLELLAATPDFKTFLKNKSRMSVLLR